MHCFVFLGNRKIDLKLQFKNVSFLGNPIQPKIQPAFLSIEDSIEKFILKNQKAFLSKRACVVIPDQTRDFHPKIIVPLIAKYLEKVCKGVDFIISLGLHRQLNSKELDGFLGKDFVRNNRIIQHSLQDVKSLGNAGRIPVYINKNLFSYDVIFTIGVVEPHLYAGFSGGIKCIAVGLAGKKTILATHSTRFLTQKRIEMANIKANPFYMFLWEVFKKIRIPVYSLNIVNDIYKNLVFYSLGEPKRSFLESVEFAKKWLSCRIKDKFDVLFVGCDYPKDKNLYQASRLFNYCLDKKPLVRKGGTIFVFASLDSDKKSKAEENFEEVLRRGELSKDYKFKKTGEHRAFKVLEASRYARLAIITQNIPGDKFSSIYFFKDIKSALQWSKKTCGNNPKIGVIPAGFSFIPT